MRPAWEKLFRSVSQGPQYAGMVAPLRNESSGAMDGASKNPFGQTPVEDFTPNSEKVVRTFDSIGRRNETLRVQLDAIEYSFRDIEAVRTQFRNALVTIDETLSEIERTKVAHVEAERKLESLTAEHERLKEDRAALRIGRDALAASQGELSARAAELERAVTAAEAASWEARAALSEQNAKLEQRERDLEDNRRALNAASGQLPSLRAEFAVRENRLQLVERQRAELNDHCNLLAQENDTLRTRIEEFVVNSSKLGRHVAEMKDQRDELERRLEDADTSLAQETAAHAKLKTAYLDAVEAHRVSEASLQEKLAAATTRLDAAERLLSDARAAMHEQDAATRDLEQRVLEKSLAVKSLEAQIADLERDLNSARLAHVEGEAARAAELERSTAIAKSQTQKEAALQRAEQRIASLEARFEEHKKAALGDRTLFEEKIAELMNQLEAQSAARLFAEGALQSARQERCGRRDERDEAPSPDEAFAADDKGDPAEPARLQS
jgi:chromosome segregation ATPase